MKRKSGFLILGVAQIIFLILCVYAQIPVFLMPAPVVVWLGWTVWGSCNIRSQLFVNALCRIPAEKGVVITFDDGPHPAHTSHILEVLKKHGVKALFFLIGENAIRYPDLTKAIAAQGHCIGNHSYRHGFFFSLQDAEKMKREIFLCHEALENLIGRPVVFFRPPYGVTNPALAKALKYFPDYVTVGWSLRTLDTLRTNEKKMVRSILQRVKAGDIVLLHDRCAVTARSLDALLQGLKESGMVVSAPDVLLESRAVSQ